MKEKIKLIKEGKLSAVENIQKFVNKIKKENGNLNIVLHLNDNAVEDAKVVDEKIKKGERLRLAGLGVLVKSNINVCDLICSCASRTLENYKSGYDASVVSKLRKEGAVVLGVVNMDEFACGSSGELSAFGVCKNPKVLDRIPGGSSSGSAAGVAAGFCDFSLGSDTGGSIRNPASHCGVVGFKPSYGSVSRYGLIDLSMSLDQIGPLGLNVEDCELVYNVIKGKDERDGVSREIPTHPPKNEKIKVGILGIKADDKIWGLVKGRVEEVCIARGWKVEEVSLEHVDLGIQTYYPIVYTEFFSGTRKFDGRKYGLKIEDSCGEEVLRRILGGMEISKAEYAGKYYRKALTVRKLIREEFARAFEKYDIIVCPTVPKLPHKIGERLSVEENYAYDVCTCLANIAEIPAISVPCGSIDGVPVGLQLLGKVGSDEGLLKVGREFER